jgi:hypothetical protein
MVGLNVRKWGFYDKTVKNFKPFCWWDAFRSVWMTQQNAPIIFFRHNLILFLVNKMINNETKLGTKRKPVVPPQGIRCQKCLEYGHWSYECKGQRKYLHRSSRTHQLRKRMKLCEEKAALKNSLDSKSKGADKKKSKTESSSNSDSSSSSSTDSSSGSSSSTDSDSSSSDSEP